MVAEGAGRYRAARDRGPRLQLAFGSTVALLMLFLAAFGPQLAPYDPLAATGDVGVPPPPLSDWPGLMAAALRGDLASSPHWFGTDFYGLDVFSRVIAAPRTDLTIALGGALLSMLVGTVLGVLVACFPGWWSEALMRFSDVLQSFPVFIIAMVLVALAGRQTGNIVLALCLVYTPIFLRLTRAEALVQARRGYVEAARVAGGGRAYIAWRHVLVDTDGLLSCRVLSCMYAHPNTSAWAHIQGEQGHHRLAPRAGGHRWPPHLHAARQQGGRHVHQRWALIIC